MRRKRSRVRERGGRVIENKNKEIWRDRVRNRGIERGGRGRVIE